jgi:hypothetical protein
MAKPAELYRKSVRDYDGDVFDLEYPVSFLKRLVCKTGHIRMSSRRIFISTALYGYHVGLQPCENNNYLLWLGDLYLGELDSTTELLVPAQQKK